MAANRDDTFLIYYLDDFAEFNDENPSCLVCLSESTVQIILSALRFSTWPTRWRQNRDDPGRRIDAELWDSARRWGELAYWEVLNDMSCDFEAGFNTLAEAITEASNKTALQSLADAVRLLANKQCCDDLQIDIQGGYQGTTPSPEGVDTPIYGSQPPVILEEGGYPEGYENIEDYLSDKCKIANQVFDGVVASLENVATIGTFNAVALAGLIAASMAFGIIFPPALIPTAISVLLILSGSLFLVAQLAGLMNENKEDLVCILYEGENAQNIIGLMSDAIDILLGSIPVSGMIAWSLKSLFLLIMNTDTLNQLFDGTSAVGYAEADCSGCADEECSTLWDFNDGTVQGFEGVADFPACFTFAEPPAGILTNPSTALRVAGQAAGATYKSGSRIAGLEKPLSADWFVRWKFSVEVAGSVYFDAVLTTVEGSCWWVTVTNNALPGGTSNISRTTTALEGETLDAIYMYCQSNSGAAGMVTVFDEIEINCGTPEG